jgi:rubrerythrin
MRKNFFDLDAYEDYDIVQEGTEIGSLDFKFDDDEPVVQEAVVEEEKGPDKEATEKEIVQEASDKLSPDQVDEFYGKLKDELSQDDDTVKEAIAKEEAPKEEEPRTEETIEEDSEVTKEKSDLEDVPEIEDVPTAADDALEGSTTPDGDDLKDFGTDTSDVQNEYDPKEIEILNKLIAAEAEAINDYFDASKDSHDSNARRLYSDIGHEERFHMEQLMFQKAQFTGEKYEPRDPEVKKEYEELLQMGMDDETAMHTAIDKQSMIPTDDGDDSDMEAFAIAFESALTLLRQNEILMEAVQYAYDKRGNKEIFNNFSIITEAYLYQEDVVNTASMPKEVKKFTNPVTLLIKGLKAAVNGLLSAANTARDAAAASRVKRQRKLEWIKKNGITGLFKSGVSFYFYNDKNSTFDMTQPCQYVDLLYRLSVAIGKKCGVQPTKQGYHGTIKNPIKFNTIGDGMAMIKQLQMTKTKVIVTDQNKDALTNEFFGYNDQKINVKVWNEEANKAIYESNNVYTKLQLFGVITNNYLDITLAIMEVLERMQGDTNSIYYKNRALYNDAVNNLKIISTVYRKFINACVSDLAEMQKFDKSVLEETRAHDVAVQTGQKWEGDTHRTSGGMAKEVPNANKYAKKK